MSDPSPPVNTAHPMDSARAVLERIANEDERYVDGARVLSSHSGVAALAALLEAVDDTILPRALEFTCGDGLTLDLQVSNRRILRVIGGSFGPAEKLRGQELMAASASQVVFETMIMTFCESGAPLTLRTAPLTEPEAPLFGLSAETLRRAFAVALADFTGEDFFRSIRSVLLAWNDGTDEDGDQTLLDELDDIFEQVDTDEFETPFLGLTKHAERDGIFVGVAKLNTLCLSFMVAQEQLRIVTRAFHSDPAP